MQEVAAVVEIIRMREAVVETTIEMTIEVVEAIIEAVVEAASVAEAKVEGIVMIIKKKKMIKITTTHPATL